MRQLCVQFITDEEVAGLEQLHRNERTHDERGRAQFILFSAAGHDLLHASQLAGISRKTADQTMRVLDVGSSGGAGCPLLGRVSALRSAPMLIWDNGPTHRNRKVAAWLAAHP